MNKIVYNVLFESQYENEDITNCISTFANRKDAVKFLETALDDEIIDGGYTEEEVSDRLVRKGDGFFCFYHDDCKSNWKFRCKIFESEVI